MPAWIVGSVTVATPPVPIEAVPSTVVPSRKTTEPEVGPVTVVEKVTGLPIWMLPLAGVDVTAEIVVADVGTRATPRKP